MDVVTRSHTLPEAMSRAANEAAKQLGMSYSEMVRQALLRQWQDELGWTRAEVMTK